MNDFEAAVIDVIAKNLRIESSFAGWEYNDVANELELKIMLGDHEVARSTVRIEPVQRDSSDW